MKIAITAESTIDLPQNILDEYKIRTLPFTVIMGEEEFADGTIDPQRLYDFTKETKKLPKTSAINQFQYEEFFKKVLEDSDHIIHFCLSSAISSACKNAQEAAEGFKGKVTIIDTKSLSTGIALQAIYASELADAGYSPEEIEAKVLERRKYARASFTIETLDNLFKGGRCSALSMLGANLLHLKPQIIVQEDGSMTKDHIYRGPLMKVNEKYVEDELATYQNIDKKLIFITHSGLPENVLAMIREKLQAAGFSRIEETRASATITVYCGPNTVGVLFYSDGDHPITPKN